MATVKVTSGPARGETLEIDREIVIGREGADLTVDDDEMSRRHLAFRPAEGGAEVEDLGSLNGTFVEGKRIDGSVTLSKSVAIRAGTTTFEVEVPAPQPVAPQVTAASPVVERPGPDVTAPRQAPVAPPPDVTAPRQVPAGVPAAAEPPAAGPPAARRPPPIGAILGVLVLVVAIVLLVASSGDSRGRHGVNADVRNSLLEFKRPTELATGIISGAPFSGGSTRFSNTYPGSLEEALPGPTEVRTSFDLFFDEGSVSGKGQFTVEGTRGKDARISGKLVFTDGTGDFADAKGSATIEGAIDGDVIPPRTNATLRGSIEY